MLRRCVFQRGPKPALPVTNLKADKFEVMKYDEALALRKKHVHGAIPVYYKKPVYVVQGKMQYLWDHEGTRYLDLFGGVCTVGVGHNHPKLVEALKQQADRLWHTTHLYLTEPIAQCCETIVSKLPKEEKWKIYLTNSGSEANDFATLLARAHTRNTEIIALRNGYHGGSEGTRGLTSVQNWMHAVPTSGSVKRVLTPVKYRGFFQGPDALDLHISELEELITQETAGDVACFIAERIQGVGGCVPLLDGYLKRAYEVVRRHNGLCISDEVQCGWGRLGDKYWGFETEGVIPDIVVMAKSIANGFPCAAVACREEISSAIHKLHFNTYGGNPLSAVVCDANIKAIDEDKLMENSHVVGNLIMDGCRKLMDKHEVIGDVRGRGLIIGIELVKCRKTKVPHSELATSAMEMLKELGCLVGKGGAGGNVLRVQPPMCLSAADGEFFVAALDYALENCK